MVEHFENYNTSEIMIPVNPHVLQELLIESNYDRGKTQYLVNGFQNGFSIGYQGPAK